MIITYVKRMLLTLVMGMYMSNANATLTTDLQSLVTGFSAVNDSLASMTFGQNNTCTELGTLNTSIEDYLATMESIYAQLSAPLNLTTDDLTSLDDLSNLAKSMSSEAARISGEMRTVEGIYDLFEYRAALSAMLRLSDDIGTMADRILEMADRILVMADNIGIMADRILTTEQLQNTNIALTQAAILTTQDNMVALSDSLSSTAYNLTLGQLVNDTQSLSDNMAVVSLTQTNMATQLSALEATTTDILNRTINLYSWATANSQFASHYINGDTLTMLGDLSAIHKALALSLETYANAINTLAPLTDNIVLRDATASMLRLTQDIGVMSDRIMQMTDKIIVMADNIGLMSDRIVDTQNLQQTNIDLTKNSVITAQNVTITVIKNMGL